MGGVIIIIEPYGLFKLLVELFDIGEGEAVALFVELNIPWTIIANLSPSKLILWYIAYAAMPSIDLRSRAF